MTFGDLILKFPWDPLGEGIGFKVNNPYSIAFLFIGMPILEWYVVWCGFKDG